MGHPVLCFLGMGQVAADRGLGGLGFAFAFAGRTQTSVPT